VVTIIDNGSKVVVSRKGTQGLRGGVGETGASGADGVMAENEVVSILREHLHANALTDGLEVAPDGNITVTIGSLLPLP
jgi:hypothetical protein